MGSYWWLVERVHELLVVEPPVGPHLRGEERVADRVALPAVGLERADRAIDLVHPALALRREDRVPQEATGVRDLVDRGARHRDLVVRQEVPRLVVERRAGE